MKYFYSKDISQNFEKAEKRIVDALIDIGFGVFIFIRDTNQNVISNNLKKINNNNPSKEIELREYGVGAQILLDIGVRNIKLISNSKSTLLNIEGYNLEINERVPLVD